VKQHSDISYLLDLDLSPLFVVLHPFCQNDTASSQFLAMFRPSCERTSQVPALSNPRDSKHQQKLDISKWTPNSRGLRHLVAPAAPITIRSCTCGSLISYRYVAKHANSAHDPRFPTDRVMKTTINMISRVERDNDARSTALHCTTI
jgi:hypothetical protein